MFQDITINTGSLFAAVIAAHYLYKGLDWLQELPARRRALKSYAQAKAMLEELKATAAKTAAELQNARSPDQEFSSDFISSFASAETSPASTSFPGSATVRSPYDAGASESRPLVDSNPAGSPPSAAGTPEQTSAAASVQAGSPDPDQTATPRSDQDHRPVHGPLSIQEHRQIQEMLESISQNPLLVSRPLDVPPAFGPHAESSFSHDLDTPSLFKADVTGLFKVVEDFAQPTPENLEQAFRRATDHLPQPPAKPLQPDCMFMTSLDPSVAVASRRRPLPGHPAPLHTVTSNGNPIIF